MYNEKVNVNEANETAKTETTTYESAEPETLEISVPDDITDEAFARLEALVSSKKSLLAKSLEAEELKVIREDGKLKFPWFKLHGIEGEGTAYMQLVTAMVKFAKDATRIDPTEKEIANEKFTMRIFTVRLGLKGDEYKLLRKLLSANLTGNSAWRNGTPPEKVKAKAAANETTEAAVKEVAEPATGDVADDKAEKATELKVAEEAKPADDNSAKVVANEKSSTAKPKKANKKSAAKEEAPYES